MPAPYNYTKIAEPGDPGYVRPPVNASVLNAVFAAIDEAIGAAVATLSTTAKTLVGAVNELDAQVDGSIDSDGTLKANAVDGSGVITDGVVTDAKLATDVKVGSLAALTTDDKSSVTDAINEIDANTDAAAASIADLQIDQFRDDFTRSDGAIGNGWTGSTATVASNRAVITPTVGSDLLTDGAMENWNSATDLTSWTETLAGTSTINREAADVHGGTFACRYDIDGSNSSSRIGQAIGAVAGRYVRVLGWHKASTTGKAGRFDLTAVQSVQVSLPTTWTQIPAVVIPAVSSPTLYPTRVSLTSASWYLDDFSAKVINFKSMCLLRNFLNADGAFETHVANQGDATHAGLVLRADSISNPRNCLVAYQQGVNYQGYTVIRLDKVLSEMLANLGFETAGGGGADVFGSWTESAGTGAIARTTTAGEFRSGAAAAKLTAGATVNTNIYQQIAVMPGEDYTVTFWTRGDGTYAGRYRIYNATAASDITALTSTGVTGTTYTQVTATFTAPAACYLVSVMLYCPGTNAGIAYFDDVSASYDDGPTSVTNLLSQSVLYDAGAKLQAFLSGSSVHVYYGGKEITSSPYTITDSVLLTGTYHGLFATNEENTFEYFLWQRMAEPLPVVYLGGSITNGSAATAGNSWREQVGYWLNRNYMARHPTHTNSGVGGTASWYGLVRAATDVTAYSPKAIFIDFGLNDSADDVLAGDRASGFAPAAEALIRVLRAACPDAKLFAWIFTYPDSYSDMTTARRNSRNKWIKLAARYGLTLLRWDTHLESVMGAGYADADVEVFLNAPDDVHPNTDGHYQAYTCALPQLVDLRGNYPGALPVRMYATAGDSSEDFEYTPQDIDGVDNDGEANTGGGGGSWSTVDTTARQSSTANDTILFENITCCSIGWETNYGGGAGSMQYSLDGGSTWSSTIDLSAQGTSIRAGTHFARAEKDVMFKVISGTVKIIRFLAI